MKSNKILTFDIIWVAFIHNLLVHSKAVNILFLDKTKLYNQKSDKTTKMKKDKPFRMDLFPYQNGTSIINH